MRCSQARVVHRLPPASLPAVQLSLTEGGTRVGGVEAKGPTVCREFFGFMESRDRCTSVGQRVKSCHRAQAGVLTLHDLKLVGDVEVHINTVPVVHHDRRSPSRCEHATELPHDRIGLRGVVKYPEAIDVVDAGIGQRDLVLLVGDLNELQPCRVDIVERDPLAGELECLARDIHRHDLAGLGEDRPAHYVIAWSAAVLQYHFVLVFVVEPAVLKVQRIRPIHRSHVIK